MKTRHLIMVSLLLALITMGAVSASQNVTADDATVDSVGEAPVGQAAEQSEDSDLLELEPSDFNYHINDSIDLDGGDKVVFNCTLPEDGYINCYVDDMSEKLSFRHDSGDIIQIDIDKLRITQPGTYHVKFEFEPDTGNNLVITECNLTVNKTYVPADFDVRWYDVIYTDENVVEVLKFPAEGTLYVYVNGENRFFKKVNGSQQVKLNSIDLGVTSQDQYLISLKFTVNSTSQIVDLGQNMAEWIRDRYVHVYNSVNIINPNQYVVYFFKDNPPEEYLNGTITVQIDDVLRFNRTVDDSEKIYELFLNVADLNITEAMGVGNHTLNAVYVNGVKKHEFNGTIVFRGEPDYDDYIYMSVGETDAITIGYFKGFTGNATIYDGLNKEVGCADFVDGIARIPIGPLANDYYSYSFKISGVDGDFKFTIDVRDNSKDITSKISASEITVGDSVAVTYTGSQEYITLTVEIDGVHYSDIPLKNGTVSETISNLTVGKHQIKLLNIWGFYSNSFYVIVKEAPKPTPAPAPAKKVDTVKLTLKKVKVKRSAKKLVLQATLKINGKAVKGKIIKFKFNKKTYKAKTDRKGVAKVTIIKKVLKKLKNGKKVKIQATYGKVTKKFTAKVKK